MFEKTQRRIMLPRGGGILRDLSLRIKLAIRLFNDARVSLFLKLLPIGSLAYLVIPDLIPLPFDDAAVIGMATYLFVELCPADLVQEHLADLTRTKQVLDEYSANQPGQAAPRVPKELSPEGEVVDGTLVEKNQEPG